jgi:hypothetical protein
MPIARDDHGFLFWPDAWGTPALGLETDRMHACIEEVRVRQLGGVFGRHPEFKETDLSCLEAIPDLTGAAFWDTSLTDISTIYFLPQLAYFRERLKNLAFWVGWDRLVRRKTEPRRCRNSLPCRA